MRSISFFIISKQDQNLSYSNFWENLEMNYRSVRSKWSIELAFLLNNSIYFKDIFK